MKKRIVKSIMIVAVLFSVFAGMTLVTYADNNVSRATVNTAIKGYWKNQSGRWYFVNAANGQNVTGWMRISNATYYFNNSGVMQTGWLKYSNNWYYFKSSGAMATGWAKVGGKWYYMNGSGVMQTGWQRISNKWYYLDGSGAMRTGWQQVGGKWYYMDSSGAMRTGWQRISNKWYYMDGSGAMKTGWQQVGSKWYYMNSSGAMQTGWQRISNKWYYMDGSGARRSGWQQVGGKWYYMDSSGVMQTGWIQVGTAKYYLDGSGAMRTGWQKLNNEWYYFNSSGAMKTGWLLLGKTWYYLDADGVMATGWTQVGGAKYYLNGSGAMKTGWLKLNDEWYYLDGSGAMKTGWIQVGTAKYYMDADGVMQTGWVVIDGKGYFFKASGAWDSSIVHEHTIVNTYIEPACEQDGIFENICSVCGYVERVVDEGTALEHSYVEDAERRVEATCTEEGHEVWICEREGCSDEDIRPIEMLPHDYMELKVTEATCEKDGLLEEICRDCRGIKETVLPAGHLWVTEEHDDGSWDEYCDREDCDERHNNIRRHEVGEKEVVGYYDEQSVEQFLEYLEDVENSAQLAELAKKEILNTIAGIGAEDEEEAYAGAQDYIFGTTLEDIYQSWVQQVDGVVFEEIGLTIFVERTEDEDGNIEFSYHLLQLSKQAEEIEEEVEE